ncbi:MAG: hypothetical protein IK100_02240 [Muribaculaceae bacterium]|nr:hypothetical protein [Muribaculaceae bacterium]
MGTASKAIIIICFFFFLFGNFYAFANNKEVKTQCIEIKSPQNDSLYSKFVLRDMKLDTTFVFKTGNIDSVFSCRNDYDWKKISSDIIIAQQANVDKSAYTYLYLAEECHKMRNYVNLLALHDCQIGDTLFIMDNINTIECTRSEVSWKNSDMNNYYITKIDEYYVFVIPSSSYDTNFYTNQQSLICNWDLSGLIQEYNSKKEIMQQYTYNFGENFVSRIILQEGGNYKFSTMSYYDYP